MIDGAHAAVQAADALLPGAGPILALAVVLLAGVAGGALARRVGLPAVTGQIVAGVLLGPLLGLFDHRTVEGLRPMTSFALGLIAVSVGSHLSLRKLRNASKRLGLLLLLEVTLTPTLVFFGVRAVSDHHWAVAALLAAGAVSTAPATTVALVKEARARGVFVKTLVAAVALNNLACILLFELAHSAALVSLGGDADHTALHALLAPLGQLVGSALLGCGAGLALILVTRHVVRPDKLATASIVAILLTVGLARYIDASPLLACMFLGLVLANVTPDKDEIGHGAFANFESAIFAVFFTLAGMELDFGLLVAGGGVVVTVFLLRVAAKLTAASVAMQLAGATDRVRRWLGVALVPQAGVAVGLLLLLQEDRAMEPVSDILLAIGLAVVTANEIVGPVLARIGLERSGDAGKDRRRLIDFLREENIVTDLRADTMEEAIRRMTDVLVRSNHLADDPEEVLQSVLKREAEVSTCIGGGLAVPHGVLQRGREMVGAMGISREGLPFKTPDGRPVHCLVLLATPPSQRERHLEVLAALARAIGLDPVVQAQLFTARSAAHAYEILHAEEGSLDFNYFLDE